MRGHDELFVRQRRPICRYPDVGMRGSGTGPLSLWQSDDLTEGSQDTLRLGTELSPEPGQYMLFRIRKSYYAQGPVRAWIVGGTGEMLSGDNG